LITIIVSLQRQLNTISSQLNYLTEQIALMNQRTFGRKTEQLSQMEGQMNLFDVLNEPEFFSDDSPEPEITEVVVSTRNRKKKSSREQNLEGLPARIYEHCSGQAFL
ncbi:MAG: transposase, partial [Lachnospiraceae bacterium]|nr:transposase [Lachnospiraceae bacterium]